MNKKLLVAITLAMSLSQGINLDKVIEIFNKITELHLTNSEYIIILLYSFIIYLFYRGILFLYKITIILEQLFIAKFKKKVSHNLEEEL
jgi:hypothetical protein